MNQLIRPFSCFPIVAFLGLVLCLLGIPDSSRCVAYRFGRGSTQPNPPNPNFDNSGRWPSTTAGSTGSLGSPATLTWSIVPDGATLPASLIKPTGSSGGVNETNSFVNFLDGIHHNGASPGGADLTQRAWFSLIESAFERWESLSGLTYNFERNDDGGNMLFRRGESGVRGDHRIAGHSLDGNGNNLAFSFFPRLAGIVVDLDESYRWSHPNNNFRTFRNMLMHEIGHGFGLNHVDSYGSPSGNFLMAANLTTIFDGPQFDDILGVQRLYGDVLEVGGGNDTSLNATPLGTVGLGQPVVIGADANDTFVAGDEIDFASIDDDSDVDFFSFTISQPGLVGIHLTPLGPTYREGPQNGSLTFFDSSAQSDLTLTLLDTDGVSVLEFSNHTGMGFDEEISNFNLPLSGDYFVRIGGLNDRAQFYQLELTKITSVPEPASIMILLIGSLFWRRRD